MDERKERQNPKAKKRKKNLKERASKNFGYKEFIRCL